MGIIKSHEDIGRKVFVKQKHNQQPNKNMFLWGSIVKTMGIFGSVYQAGSPSDTKHKTITVASLICISSRQVSSLPVCISSLHGNWPDTELWGLGQSIYILKWSLCICNFPLKKFHIHTTTEIIVPPPQTHTFLLLIELGIFGHSCFITKPKFLLKNLKANSRPHVISPLHTSLGTS